MYLCGFKLCVVYVPIIFKPIFYALQISAYPEMSYKRCSNI